MQHSRPDPVDEVLPLGMLFTFGLQHALVMYSGTVAVPLIFAATLGMDMGQTITLINSGLMTSGIATIIQTVGIGKIGSRLPIVQGSSFVTLASMLMIGQAYGTSAIFGAIIGAGGCTLVLAPALGRLMRFFPPVAIGCLLTVIGLTLIPVAGMWLGGGTPSDAAFGSAPNLLLGGVTMAVTLAVYALGSGFVSNISVLLGLIVGSLVALACGMGHFQAVHDAPWFALSMPMAFGVPTFHLMPVVIMTLTMLVILAETTGNCIAVGRLVERPTNEETLIAAFRADGLSTMLGGVFNSFPFNAFTQNTGLIAMTDIRSRFVVAAAGVVLIVLGLFPKLGAVIAAMPAPVLGGCALVMFGMTAMGGIRELSHVRFDGTRNGMIAAVSMGLGMLPMACPTLFAHTSGMARLFLGNGVFLCVCSAVVLNLLIGEKIPTLEEELDPDSARQTS
ncbi:purine permease [Gluconacetobacter entanii]|uniref:Purine permease n=1 Tax=Gluconacetobacter entanii TaxID=108528 RepID=A0ABT3K5U9_9PROT|nr:nucleobase:cation symporter-2 family protein [Gluconacetobacter entanii]MCW4590541.1 purine permease [Gluconacetobacter entanii]MCW4594058.1 purine permease [Gluconacetobacter entanii]NPC89149.1 purine permease [Gluconacetobacter entanii]